MNTSIQEQKIVQKPGGYGINYHVFYHRYTTLYIPAVLSTQLFEITHSNYTFIYKPIKGLTLLNWRTYKLNTVL